MKRPAIPSVTIPERHIAAILQPMKVNVETLTGVRGEQLPTSTRSGDLLIPERMLDTLVDNELMLAQKINELNRAVYDLSVILNKIVDRLST